MRECNPKSLQYAILHAFRPVANREVAARLRNFSLRDWRGLGSWLQASGLGLYFAEELRARDTENAIPTAIRKELSSNLADNRARMHAMQAEFVRVNAAFRTAKLDVLNVKGFGVGPEYCPTPAARQQFDLDFWLSTEDTQRCKSVLVNLGYAVHDAGYVLECRTVGTHTPMLRDFYKPPVQHALEIHLIPTATFAAVPRSTRLVEGELVQTLSREQAFVNYALHLAKHLRSEWTRASWMLELRNAIQHAEQDTNFWEDVRRTCPAYSVAALSVAIAAAAQVFAFAIPCELASWTTDNMPVGTRQWVDLFAEAVVTAPFPGTKLYLLLERELSRDEAGFRRKRRAVLMPMRVPGFLAAATAPHGWRGRVTSAQFAASRFRFHVSQGIKFLRAERAWNQRNTGHKEHVGNKGESIA